MSGEVRNVPPDFLRSPRTDYGRYLVARETKRCSSDYLPATIPRNFHFRVFGRILIIFDPSSDISQNAADCLICAGTSIADADEISPEIVLKPS